MVFKSLSLLTGTLFPTVSTDCAAARDPIKRANFSSQLLYKQTDSRANNASPDPILSIT